MESDGQEDGGTELISYDVPFVGDTLLAMGCRLSVLS
jgi:hypothetical protein